MHWHSQEKVKPLDSVKSVVITTYVLNDIAKSIKLQYLVVSIVVKFRDRHLEDHREVGLIGFFEEFHLQPIR